MKNDIKNEAYFQIDGAKWLNDAVIRRLKPEERSFLFDLKNVLAQGFPFGYCADLHRTKLLQHENIGMLQSIKGWDSPLMSTGRIKWWLAYKQPLERQLAVAIDREPHLHVFLSGYKPEEIAQHLKTLLAVGIINRNADEFIYDSDLVDQFQSRVIERKAKGISRPQRSQRRKELER